MCSRVTNGAMHSKCAFQRGMSRVEASGALYRLPEMRFVRVGRSEEEGQVGRHNRICRNKVIISRIIIWRDGSGTVVAIRIRTDPDPDRFGCRLPKRTVL